MAVCSTLLPDLARLVLVLAARTQSGRFTGAAVDLVRNVRAVQAFGRNAATSATFGGHSRALLTANLKAVTVEARWAPIADVVLAAGAGIVLVVGGTGRTPRRGRAAAPLR